MMIYPILWLIVALISLMPVYIFWIGYRKTRSQDLFVTAIAFTLFLIKALTLSIALFLDGLSEEKWYFDDEFWVGIAALLDMIIIALIASALMGRFNQKNGHEPVIPMENGEYISGSPAPDAQRELEPNTNAEETPVDSVDGNNTPTSSDPTTPTVPPTANEQKF